MLNEFHTLVDRVELTVSQALAVLLRHLLILATQKDAVFNLAWSLWRDRMARILAVYLCGLSELSVHEK